MTPIDKLRALLKEATPGPWLVDDKRVCWNVIGPTGIAFDDGSAGAEYNQQCTRETRNLIVAMRNHLPALLDVVEAAEECRAAEVATIAMDEPSHVRAADARAKLDADLAKLREGAP